MSLEALSVPILDQNHVNAASHSSVRYVYLTLAERIVHAHDSGHNKLRLRTTRR